MTTEQQQTAEQDVAVHDDGAALAVRRGDVELFRYVYRPTDVPYESPRPYVHPLRTPGGDVVTAYRPWDHVWHKGIAWSLPHVGPWNFWGGPNYVRERGTYVDLGNDGSMDHERFESVDASRVVEELAWRTPPTADGTPGDVVVRERRTLGVHVPDGEEPAWVLTFRSEMTNVSDGPLDIGSPTTNGRENAGYGGLFWRGPRSFTEGQVILPDDAGHGLLTDGEDARGVHAPWLGFVGRHDGPAPGPEGGSRASTVLMVDGGANPGGEPQWFVRSVPFACLCPAPAFSTELPFGTGRTLTFDYAVVVADGASDGARGAALAALGRRVLDDVLGTQVPSA
ncbi:PmoA family protein [Isoptericola variabilis]|uniref:Methane oxygenase PmoA n=1 Tax=Isoptericola variabilis (strain 225) TaxID=743718 RepID=F6FU76_ISOV2|nr:PmoA family protein [Isoptericola variabilis]AEG43272.1 hypothetical protein Isova_0475 [Isoptericola variabilis 225]TWH35207.1 methane monooxygenase PmoA-like [Isoptericola variabilis J7]